MPIILPDIVQTVQLNTRDAVAGTLQVARAFRSMGREATSESTSAAAAISVLQARIDELGDEAARAKRKVEDLNQEIAKLRATSAGGGRGGGGGGDVMANLAKSAGFFAAAIAALKIPVIIFGIGQLIPLIGSLAAGMLALSSALGPVAGGFAALPGLIAPIVQGFGSVALAVSGVGDAFKLYGKAQEDAKQTNTFAAEAAAAARDVSAAQREVNRTTAEMSGPQTLEAYTASTRAARDAQAQLTAAQQRQADVTKRQNAAQKEYEDALKKMDPSVRRFVETTESLRGKFEAVRRAAQAGLFPGVTDALIQVSTLFEPIGHIARVTAQVFGDFARKVADFVTEAGFLRDFRILAADNVSVLEKAGDFLLNIMSALVDIGVAARPLVTWFADLAVETGEWLRDWASVGRETGRFTAFFERTRDTLTQLGSIIRNVSGGLMSIFRAGAQLGRQMMFSFEMGTKRFNEWTRSAEGQKRINEFFREMQPILYEVGRLVSAIFRSFGQLMMDNNEQTAALVRQLREEFLPALTRLFATMGEGFGPRLIDLLTTFADMLSSVLSNASGPLNIMLDVLNGIFKILGAITEIPVLRELVFALLAAVAAFRAFKFAAIITGFNGAFKAVAAFTKGLQGAALAAKAAEVSSLASAHKLGTGFAKVAAMTAGQLPVIGNVLSKIGIGGMAVFQTGGAALARMGGYALAAGVIWSRFTSIQENSRKKAQEMREEIEAPYDLSNFTGLAGATNSLIAQHSRVVDEWNSKGLADPGVGGALNRLGRGLWEMLPGTKKTMADLAAQDEDWGNRITENTARLNAMQTVYSRVGGQIGLTAAEVETLATEFGVNLTPAIEGVIAGAADVDTRINAAADAMGIAKHRAQELSPEMESLWGGLERISESGANATDRLNAFGDILDGLLDPLTNAEKAQARYDEIMGKSTKTVKEYNDETESVKADWAEKQKQATEDLKRANENLADAKAAVGKAKTWDEWKSASEAIKDAEDEVAAAKAAQTQVNKDATAAINRSTRATSRQTGVQRTGMEGAHDLIDATKDLLRTEYAHTGSLDKVREKYQQERPELERTLRQMGLNEEQVRRYMGELDKIPDAISTAVLLTKPTDQQVIDILSGTNDAVNRLLAANPALRPLIMAKLGIDESSLAMGPVSIKTAAPTPGNLSPVVSGPTGVATTETTGGTLIFDPLTGGISFKPRQAGAIDRGPQTTDTAILWGEGRGTEAYIPYDTRYRKRAVGLMSRVASDFGYSIVPRMARGGIVPFGALDHLVGQMRQLQSGGFGGGSGTTSIDRSVSHSYGGITVNTVERATGEKLGRDIAWALIGSRGPAVQKVIR